MPPWIRKKSSEDPEHEDYNGNKKRNRHTTEPQGIPPTPGGALCPLFHLHNIGLPLSIAGLTSGILGHSGKKLHRIQIFLAILFWIEAHEPLGCFVLVLTRHVVEISGELAYPPALKQRVIRRARMTFVV